jgi:hypothetical protein
MRCGVAGGTSGAPGGVNERCGPEISSETESNV